MYVMKALCCLHFCATVRMAKILDALMFAGAHSRNSSLPLSLLSLGTGKLIAAGMFARASMWKISFAASMFSRAGLVAALSSP